MILLLRIASWIFSHKFSFNLKISFTDKLLSCPCVETMKERVKQDKASNLKKYIDIG